MANQFEASFIEIFPNKPLATIRYIIAEVEEQGLYTSEDDKIEMIFNMLLGDIQLENNDEDSSLNNEIFDDAQCNEEGAVGYALDNNTLSSYFDQLQCIFPDASEDFLSEYLAKKKHTFSLNDAIDHFTTHGYDTKEIDLNSIWITLQSALPEADPEYLKEQARRLVLEGEEKIEEFVAEALENNDYPTREGYMKRQSESKTLETFTSDHDLGQFIKKFLEVFPRPKDHFEDPQRQNPLEQPDLPEEDVLYAKTFLYNKYPYIRKRHIDLVFRMKQKRLKQCCEHLQTIWKGLKVKRKSERMPDSKNLELVQEVAYLKHRRVILAELKYKNDLYLTMKEEARALGLLETCGVCSEDELIPEECMTCKRGCIFCRDCVRQYVEVKMGDGLTTFPCCNDCDSFFELHNLQLVLPRHTFERLVLKVQSEEIKNANVDGLETCPFCEFASIPPEESTIFNCENPDCLKESCRLCRHESHVPKRCNEIEYDEDVRRRTYIENMMTEALARTCYKCNKKFIKSTGCNKMVCNCGAMMCYLCSQAITSYEHFGAGKTCQLFTNDVQVDLNRVRTQAERAKRDLGNVEIKLDPTVGLENFFVTT